MSGAGRIDRRSWWMVSSPACRTNPPRRLYPLLLGDFQYAVVRGGFGPDPEDDYGENDDDEEDLGHRAQT